MSPGDADPATGYVVRVDGQEFVIGGTSAVAPLWAGLIALMNQKLGHSVGFLNPLIYGSIVGKGAFRRYHPRVQWCLLGKKRVGRLYGMGNAGRRETPSCPRRMTTPNSCYVLSRPGPHICYPRFVLHAAGRAAELTRLTKIAKYKILLNESEQRESYKQSSTEILRSRASHSNHGDMAKWVTIKHRSKLS